MVISVTVTVNLKHTAWFLVTSDCISRKSGISTEELSSKAQFGIVGDEPDCLGGGRRHCKRSAVTVIIPFSAAAELMRRRICIDIDGRLDALWRTKEQSYSNITVRVSLPAT